MIDFIKTHRTKIIITMLSLVTVAAIAVTVWAVAFRKAPVLNPDYAAQETEKDAEKIEGETPDSEPVDGGKLNIIYSPEVMVSLSSGRAALLIGNLAKSQHNIVAEIDIQGEIILQTGAILPGYRIVDVEILANAKEMLRKGVYNGTIRLYMYDKETNEREMLSSEIEAEIKVVE